MTDLNRKPKIGLLLIGSNVHHDLGTGTARGSYHERQVPLAKHYVERFEKLGDITFTEIIYNTEAVRKSIDVFFAAHVDCVIVINLSWTEDSGLAYFLREMPEIPVLFSVIEDDDIHIGSTADDDGFTNLLTHNSLIGALEASGSFRRIQRPMVEKIVGTWDAVEEYAKVFVAAARARSILREAQFGLLGPYNEVMWSTYVDPYELFAKAGPQMHFYSVSQLGHYVEQVTEEETRAAADRLKATYDMEDGIDDKKLLASVKASIGFDHMCMDKGLDCMILNDIDKALLEVLGLRPGFIWCSGKNNAVVVPEGDIGSGLAAFILHVLSGKQVNYFEPFYIQHREQWIAIGHGGPNDYRDADGKCIISSDIRYANAPIRYPAAPVSWYTFPAGEITVLHTSQNLNHSEDQVFKFAAGRAESLKTEHFMSSFNHGRMRPYNTTCEEWAQRLIDDGVTQHYAITRGNYMAELECLARMLNFSFNNLERA